MWLRSPIQQKQNNGNALCKDREEVSPLPHDTQSEWRMQLQQGSDTPAARPTLQPKTDHVLSWAYNAYIVEHSAGCATAHVEAVPQVTAGPLTVTQGALLSICLPRQRGLHGFTQVEGGFHQGIPETESRVLSSSTMSCCHNISFHSPTLKRYHHSLDRKKTAIVPHLHRPHREMRASWQRFFSAKEQKR